MIVKMMFYSVDFHYKNDLAVIGEGGGAGGVKDIVTTVVKP